MAKLQQALSQASQAQAAKSTVGSAAHILCLHSNPDGVAGDVPVVVHGGPGQNKLFQVSRGPTHVWGQQHIAPQQHQLLQGCTANSIITWLSCMQESTPAAGPNEHALQELSTLKERVTQMTNRAGQMEQKVGCHHSKRGSCFLSCHGGSYSTMMHT